MGNKILGKRSRNYFKGFNDRQLNYIKEKFSTISKDGQLDREKFKNQYKLTETLVSRFFDFVDFDQSNGISEYEFICAVHTFCNMTVAELGERFFTMVTQKQSKQFLTLKQMKNFTEVCLKYNLSLQNKSIEDKQITKINKEKFLKYDYNKNKQISKEQFIAICLKDEDYKKWFFNMGFITKNQLQFNDQIYDLVDSDVEEEIQRHLTKTNPKVDKIKRGIEHKIPNDDQFQEVEDEGDQALPSVKIQVDKKPAQEEKATPKQPWQVFIKEADCKINEKLKQNPNSPSQSLTMKHIFGYRSYDCRNNIKFDSKGNIIYHQGSVGIVMNAKGEQFFMNEHKDDIVCLDVNNDLIATGQMGSQPSVILWRSNDSKQIKSDLVVTEGLKESVGNVTLSKSSNFLAVSCNDSDHQLIVYDISCISSYKNNKKKQRSDVAIKSRGTLCKNAILDLKFTSDEKYIVAASLKQILFVKFDNSNINADRGQFGQFSNSSALCLLPLKTEYKRQKKNWMLSGMLNGSIYFWQEDKCVKAVSGHNGSVSALGLIKQKGIQSFVSGDKIGKIIVWGQNFEIVNRCSIDKLNTFSNMIVSISIFEGKSQEILVGTKSSTVYRDQLKKDLILSQKNAVIYGHNEGNLWGLAVDQSKESGIFYTGGQDQRLIKWQFRSEQNKLLQQTKCKYKIRTLSHNHVDKVLAVGYMNGVIEIFTEDLTSTNVKFDKIKNADKQILNLVKFSTDGKYVLACYTFIKPEEIKKQDKSKWSYGLIIFSFNQKQLKKEKQIDLGSKILAADFDQYCQYVRLNTQSFQFKVYKISGKDPSLVDKKYYNKEVPSLEWQSHTVFMSPETQMFKTQGVAESDIVCCERSRKRRNVFLIGDKYSKIKLFNYPCIKYPIFNKYEGHSNTVTGIQFDSEEKYVISIGGEEKSIIVWEYDPDIVNNQEFFNELKEESKQIQSDLVKAKGQQCGANPQYKGYIKQPSDFKEKYNPKRDNKLPKEEFSIQHVFGIRNQYLKDEVRNMCRFNKNFDSILFPTACLGVKMNIKTKEQTFYNDHKEDVVSFALDSTRTYMATGQMAEKNTKDPRKKIVAICVWDVQTQKILKKLNGFHTIAVVLLQFSPSGKLLFSVGNDDKNSYAVYDWKAGTILYSGPISGGKVNGIAWKNQTEFMTCGNDHVKFWQSGKGRQGKFSHGKLQSMFSCAYLKDDMYATGSGFGTVHIWKGNSTISANKAHDKLKVQTIIYKNDKMYTGADDGYIKQWKIQKNGQMKQLKVIFDTRNLSHFSEITNIKNIQQQEYGILSIDIAENLDFLVVTKGASVILFNLQKQNSKNAKIIHQGHYKGELWGLATYQTDRISRFTITAGDDKTVRLWDLQTKEQVKRIYLESKCRAVDCLQSGSFSILAADSTAKLYLIDKDLTSIKDEYTGKPYKNYVDKKREKIYEPWVEEVKFSPLGDKICYGTHGQSKYLQIVPILNTKFKKEDKVDFLGGSSAVNHIDWSRSGNEIAINTQAWQYLFYSSQGKPITTASSLRDEQWSTYTRKYGFQSQGIFQDPDHSNINTICRDPLKSILAVGYDDQTIRIFKYPCYIPNQVHKTLYGHSSHVTRVRFTDEKMLSVGGLDRTLIVWNIEGRQEKLRSIKDQEDDGLDDVDEDVDLPNGVYKKKVKPVLVQDFSEIVDQGDEFMAIKPWVGAIKQPKYKYPKATGSEPNASIELQYVFGYRSKDCRQNLFFKNSNTVIYHAAAVLIEHDIENNKQKLFTQHNDDILSIDYNRNNDIVITGQIGPKPLVCFYQNSQFKYAFKAPVSKGVIALSISPDGKLAVCVGMDENHQIAVIDLVNYIVLDKSKGSRKLITKVKWITNDEFITIGINFYGQWKFQSKKISKIIQTAPKANNVSIDTDEKLNLILVGANNSSLFNYAKDKNGKSSLFSKEQKDTQCSVIEAVKITDHFIACGMRNGKIVFLDKKNYELKATIDLNAELDKANSQQFIESYKSQNSCIRALDFYQNKMLIGTLGSQIYHVQIDSKINVKKQTWKNVMKGHYSPNPSWLNEVWGLTIAEGTSGYIMTCSDDSTVRVWSLEPQPHLVYCMNLNPKKDLSQYKTKKYPDDLRLRSIALSPNGKYVAVGAFDGTLRILKFDPTSQMMLQQQPICTLKHAKEWISDIKFGFQNLIVGSHDNGIYVYNFEKANDLEGDQDGNDDPQEQYSEFKLKLKYKPMKKHSSYITHLDVSRDSCYLQSTCGAYELLFWDLNSGKQLTGGASMLRDQKWKTWTCNIGWPVQGIYPKQQDGTFINAVDRSNASINQEKQQADMNDFYLLAAGNDHGKVAVYNYPCLIKNSKYIQGKGHSSHVTNVRWTKDDSHIISVGGEDQCVMVWKVEKRYDNKKTKTNTKKANKSRY